MQASASRQAPSIDELDFLEELRLRTWARANFVPTEERDANWHPVILEEMRAKDEDLVELEQL